MPDRWADIPPSVDPAEPNLRRADPAHPLDFWRGRDFQGRYIFQLDGHGQLETIGKWPAPAGIDLHPVPMGQDRYRLRLILFDEDDRELFRALCVTLLDATSDLTREGDEALRIVVSLLFKWQDMLARRKASLLSPQEALGLFGELLFLRDVMLTNMSAAPAVHSWRGPYGDEQDFLFAGTIFEIKTTIATSDRRLRISSEDQLDTTSGPIVLCQQNLSVTTATGDDGRSLGSLVDEIRALVGTESEARDRLEGGLVAGGYSDRPEYGVDHWLLSERISYHVRDDFPRIVRSMLRPGVEKVRYSIRPDACSQFVIDLNDTLEGLIRGGS
ncbi:putative PD-(D/E)XK family protein DUF4420 [Sphingomonas sp. F9_3S_D5_B_2]